jgi:hypothetical protein
MRAAPLRVMSTLILLGIVALIVLAIWAFVGLARRTRTGHPQA